MRRVAHPNDNAPVRNIVVVRALGGIGDVLCAVPALKQIRRAFPEARITYVGMIQIEGVVARYPHLVDRFLAFPGFPGVPEMPFDRATLCAWLSDRAVEPPIDIALQMHGSGGVTNVFTALLEARRTVSYYVRDAWQPDACSLVFRDDLSEVDRWLTLAASISGANGDFAIDFSVTDAERSAARALLPDRGIRPFAIVHAGASDPRRRWSANRFAAVADALVARGLRVVLTGTPNESAAVAAVENAMNKPALNLCGQTTLGTMGALVEHAAYIVTNDTGTAHLAIATVTPSTTIFMASDPARWAAQNRQRHQVVGRGVRDVPVGCHQTADNITIPSVDDVIGTIDTALALA